ncbi:DUF2946 domain-containing protein [Burkholderia thailandensis]|uniref:DUF2946 domain-containing protein n=1 Tax=Burkholderia thailandensis (strain ATCC 700388 / DSM 13276 / CCUG 48851 / CIP 106301 / E264) TaxID=271848 RepID=Q2T7L3_BURTA|nr:DUF2946 domain-containing protein [Burkholderia thailandensis]ABC34895.1 conserved hypothetical protein [Burkholderia thailandensis E264]AJY01887.1 hypothetical protein BG87_3384 [Burkholderia thailandensis 2002721643]AVR06725.1 DUF2946 domain-containing protein [Burkholderia thailandensis]AWY61849.1 DUF2946 domain-containing protein [Burkholderia thailandensis]AWY65935.1 DUF2946 domain-containing protein [Burkholderia thailandensis]
MSNRFRKLTAWLGMLAIWLAIVAPLVSQANARPAAPRSNAVICGDEHGARPAAAGGAQAGTAHDGVAHHALHLDACGYCAFFAHSPAIGAAAPSLSSIHVAAVAPSAFSGAVAPSLERYTRAYPRAPPTDA